MPPSSPSAAGQPPLARELTKEVKQRLDFFYNLQAHFEFNAWGIVICMLVAPFYLGHKTEPAINVLFVPIELLLLIPFVYLPYRRIRRIYDTFQQGRVIIIKLVSIEHTHTPYTYNGRHRALHPDKWTIVISRPEGPLRIDTHEKKVAQAFDVPEQPALIHSEYPNTLIPGYLFTAAYRDFEGEAALATMPRMDL
jgi:hypothetical protein